MADEEKVSLILVTAKNHQFVSEMTGLTLLEVHRAYQEAQDDDIVCVLETKPSAVFNVFDLNKEDANDGDSGF